MQPGTVDGRSDGHQLFEPGNFPLPEQLPGVAEVRPVTRPHVRVDDHIGFMEQDIVQIHPRDGVGAKNDIKAGMIFESPHLARHIHRDHHACPHLPRAADRDALNPSSVNEQHVVVFHRRKDARESAARTDRFPERSAGVEHPFSVLDVRGHAAEGDLGLLDGNIGYKRIDELFVFLLRYERRFRRGNAPEVSLPDQVCHIGKKTPAIVGRLLQPADEFEACLAGTEAPEELLHPCRPVRGIGIGSVQSADQRPEARTGYHINGDPGVFEDFEHSEVGKPPRRPTAQRQAYLRFHLRSLREKSIQKPRGLICYDSIRTMECKGFS